MCTKKSKPPLQRAVLHFWRHKYNTMSIAKLSNATFELFAAQHYDNPECEDMHEFQEDLNRFKYIKRILRKYKRTKTIDDKSIRLALNHLILIFNLWGVKAGSIMLFFKIDKDLYPALKTFCVYLHSLPKSVNEINTDEIPLDANIVKKLRQI